MDTISITQKEILAFMYKYVTKLYILHEAADANETLENFDLTLPESNPFSFPFFLLFFFAEGGEKEWGLGRANSMLFNSMNHFLFLFKASPISFFQILHATVSG